MTSRDFQTPHVPGHDAQERRSVLQRTRDIASSTPAEIALGAATALAGSALFIQHKTEEAERGNPPFGTFVTVEGVRLHYVERGEGDPVAILHGDGSMIQEIATSGVIDLLSRRYRVLVFDRPGYGHSSRPRGRRWTAANQAALIMRALHRLAVERPILVGHSWGTQVALGAALGRPSTVRGLVLMGGYYYPTPRRDVAILAAPAIPVVGDLMRYTISPVLARLAWPLLIRRIFSPRPVPRRFSAGYPKWMALRPSQLRAAASELATMMPTAAAWRDRYGELQIPVAILAGGGDKIVEVDEHSVRLHHDVPGSTLRVLPGLGHMLHHFSPEAVVEAVDQVAAASDGRTAADLRGYAPETGP